LDQDKIKNKLITYQKVVDKYETLYQKIKKETNDILIPLLQLLQNTIGQNTNLNNENIFLWDNAYIINHDHYGNKIEPIIITDKDKKLIFKANHPFFRKDVFYYTNKQIGVDVFYDAISHMFIGYKESQKEYVLAREGDTDSEDEKEEKKIEKKEEKKIEKKEEKKSEKKEETEKRKEPTRTRFYLKINYSIHNRLKLLGFEGLYMFIEDIVKQLKEHYPKMSIDEIKHIVIGSLLRTRIQRLKKILSVFQKRIYQIKYGLTEKKPDISFVSENPKRNEQGKKFGKPIIEPSITAEFIDRGLEIVKKYQKNLSTIIINNKERIFKNWKAVYQEVHYKQDEKQLNIDINAHYLSVYDLYDMDNQGNLILFYLTTELTKLIEYNENKFTRVTLSNLIIDLINHCYNLFNREEIDKLYEIKRFQFIIDSSNILVDVEKKGYGLDDPTYGIYEETMTEQELADPERLEQAEDDKEMFDAVSFEGEGAMGADDEFITDYSATESTIAE
jgi:hypothetical protein